MKKSLVMNVDTLRPVDENIVYKAVTTAFKELRQDISSKSVVR